MAGTPTHTTIEVETETLDIKLDVGYVEILQEQRKAFLDNPNNRLTAVFGLYNGNWEVHLPTETADEKIHIEIPEEKAQQIMNQLIEEIPPHQTEVKA